MICGSTSVAAIILILLSISSEICLLHEVLSLFSTWNPNRWLPLHPKSSPRCVRPPGVGRAGIWAAVSRGVLSEAPSPDPGCSMRPCTHVLSDSAGILRYHSSRSNPDPGGLKKTFRVSPDYKNTAYLLRKKKINQQPRHFLYFAFKILILCYRKPLCLPLHIKFLKGYTQSDMRRQPILCTSVHLNLYYRSLLFIS